MTAQVSSKTASPSPTPALVKERNCSGRVEETKDQLAERVFEISQEANLTRPMAHRYALEALAW